MAAPTKLTAEVHSQIVRMVTAGMTFESAAQQAGISRRTLTNWLSIGRESKRKPYAAFAADLDQAVATCEGVLLTRVQKAASGGDWKAAAWILERRFGRRWAKSERHEVSGPGGGAIDIEARNAEYLETLAKLAAGRA